MKARTNYLLNNVGIFTISIFASKILVFLLVPLYTRVLSTKEYGVFDLVVSTASMVYPILTVNIADAVVRFCLDRSCRKGDVITIGLRYLFRSVAISCVIAFIAYLCPIPVTIRGMEWLVLLYCIFYAVNQFLTQLAKGLENVKSMGIAGVIGTLVMLLANILFLLVFKWGLAGFFVANILAQAVPAIYLAFKLKIWTYRGQNEIHTALEREMLAYCAPLIVTVLGWWVNSAADKYVVALMCGFAANGILSVSYKIPAILNVLQGVFIQAWQISAIKEYGETDSAQFYGDTFRTINTLLCLFCAILIIFSKLLSKFLFSKEFFQAWQYVPFLLISCVMNNASGFLGPILSAKRDSKLMAMSAVYGAGVNVILNFLLVYIFGVQGATIATAISSFVIYIVRKRAASTDFSVTGYWRVLLTWGLLVILAVTEIKLSIWYIETFVMLVLVLINMDVVTVIFRALWSRIGHFLSKQAKKQ